MRSQMAESFQEQYRIRRRRDAEYHVRTAGILFDPTEVEWLQFSEDPIPNLRKMFQNYSSGYFKAPSVGAGTANTEFEVLTGMSMRFSDRESIRIRRMPRQNMWRVQHLH